VVAVFLSVAAVVLLVGLVGGAAIGLYTHKHTSDTLSRSIAIGASVALGGVLLASVLAFFGYVLNLLTQIVENTKRQPSGLRGAWKAVGAPKPAVPARVADLGTVRSNPVHAPPSAVSEGLRDDLRPWLSW